jgi:FYVE/RhoGEF/PH domain-containing protein 5/6
MILFVDHLPLKQLFLTPIIATLDTPQSLLDRASLTSVFSNFIDIWNLHRALFSSLNEHLHPTITPQSPTATSSSPPPHLSPVLLSHFPYLSLYTPFITSFSTSLATLMNLLNTNSTFSAFIARQEADPRCGKLKLRDWLLTIVQRCPRYLLLLKDLINCTDAEDPEYSSLMAVHELVSKSMWLFEHSFCQIG